MHKSQKLNIKITYAVKKNAPKVHMVYRYDNLIG